MFAKFTGILNLILAVVAVGVGVYAAQFIRSPKARRAVQLGVVVLVIIWLGIQMGGGCSLK